MLYPEAYIGAVVEGVVATSESFGRLKSADVERVCSALVGEAFLGVVERGAEERVAVGGENDLPGLEIERDNPDMLLGDGESIDDGVGLVLLLHGLEHAGDDGLASGVVVEVMVVRLGRGGDDGSTTLGQLLLVGFGVVVVGGGKRGRGRQICRPTRQWRRGRRRERGGM